MFFPRYFRMQQHAPRGLAQLILCEKPPRQITGIYGDTGARQGFSHALRSVI